MQKSRRLGLMLVAFLCATPVILLLSSPDDREPADVGSRPDAKQRAEPKVESSPGKQVANDSTRAAAEPPPGSIPAAASAAAPPSPLRVCLRGLDASAPWTAGLVLHLDGHDEPTASWLEHEADAVPGDDGVATFALPAWVATATRQKGRLLANDANYAPQPHRWQDAPVGPMTIDVQVVARLQGRVIDAARQPVAAARVSAFVLRGSAIDSAIAAVNTAADGTYQLAVPPDTALLLIAVAMEAATGTRLQTDEGGVRDTGEARSDLLPATQRASAPTATPTAVAELVLTAAANVTGTVSWSDGTPIELATVQATPRGGIAHRIDRYCFVHELADGRMVPAVRTETREGGAFTLPGAPGVVVELRVTQLPDALLLGDLEPRVATPPDRVTIVLPAAVRLRVVDGGRPVPQAQIELASGRHFTTRADGRLELVTRTALRVRASHERRRSPWLDIVPAGNGAEVELALAEMLQQVSIEFEGDFRVRNTVLTWRSEDGREGREHLLRDDHGGPFSLFLEPGRYHLAAHPGAGERNGVFLLPVERDIDVAGEAVSLRLPAVFGGMFVVHATDSRGVYVAGTCAVIAADGKDHTSSFQQTEGPGATRRGDPGQLLADGPNQFDGMLPPGDYDLQFDFPEHGTQHRSVTIRPREVSEVRIRLP